MNNCISYRTRLFLLLLVSVVTVAAVTPLDQPSPADGKVTVWAVGALPDNKPLRIPAKVVRVVDGDTIEVELFNGTTGKVRYEVSCPLAEKIAPKNLISFNSLEQAEASGRRQCKKCRN